jgi:hypothetical protein
MSGSGPNLTWVLSWSNVHSSPVRCPFGPDRGAQEGHRCAVRRNRFGISGAHLFYHVGHATGRGVLVFVSASPGHGCSLYAADADGARSNSDDSPVPRTSSSFRADGEARGSSMNLSALAFARMADLRPCTATRHDTHRPKRQMARAAVLLPSVSKT